MNAKIERQCPACGTAYNANPARLKFGRETTCSRACSYKFRFGESRNREEFECGNCGKHVVRNRTSDPRHGLRFCSPACAYLQRKRIVDRPYKLVAIVDRKASAKKGAETRRRNAKPYPEAARREAAARMSKRISARGPISKFQNEVSDVMRSLGLPVRAEVALRVGGRFAGVVDIVSRNLAIECHGTYWHGGRWSWDTPAPAQARNLEREEAKLAAVRVLGYQPCIVWEHDFKSDPVGAVLAVIR